MKLILGSIICAFLCATTVSAFPKPRLDLPPQCADPTFACQDIQSARLCGVVKSCVHDIWSTMSAPDDNDEICDICKEMVKEARDQLLSNMTQEEIKEVFEGSCKLLPVKLVADACIKVVDEIIPELVEMLASRMDPTMVCTVSGLCNMAHLPLENHILKFLRMVLNTNKDSQCIQCTKMITDVQKFLNSSTEAEVKTYIEKFCDEKVPSYLCDIMVDTYLPQIYSYIISTKAKTLCGSVGICPKKCNLKQNEESKLKDELTCEFCEHVLQHIKDLITANTTADEFKTALLNFCKHVGSFSDKCTSLVNDYYDMLFDYIRSLDTKGMCTLLGLCDNTKCAEIPLVKLIPALDTRKRIPVFKLRPADPVISRKQDVHPLVKLIPQSMLSKKQMVESNDIFIPQLPLERYMHPLPLFEKDTECAFCKAISFYLAQELNDDKSEHGVQIALDGICEKWVKDFPDHCQQFMNKYSAKIQYSIKIGVEMETICDSMKACADENKNSELNVKVMPKMKEGPGPFCDLCKDAMNEIEKQLSDPSTKQKMENLLGQVCNILPQSLKDDCVNFINQNVDALIDILQQEMKPDNICPALGLCSALQRIQIPQRVRDLECDVCKDVVSSFRKNLEDPGSKKIVVAFLEEGCARLPGSLAQECKQFVDENIDTVMAIILQELDPDSVCSLLKICPASIKQEKPKKINDIECDLCKQVVAQLEDLIKDKRTEDEIKNALDTVCSYLPSSIATKCESFVNQYTDLLITLLAQELDPSMVCAALNVCPASIKQEKPKKLNDIECDLCKEVVAKVEDLIKDKKTEDEIKNALDKVCSYLPSSMATKCENFVNQYTDLLITLLAQELDPSMVCAALNVCPAEVGYSQWKLKAQDVECQGCQYLLHFVQEQLMNADTQEKVKDVLEKMCDLLPETLSKNCDAFVEQYGSALLVLISQEIDPKTMCYEAQMCTNKTSIFEQHLGGQLHPFNEDECSMCTTIVDYVDKLLEEDDVDKEITAVIEKVCKVLPSSYEAKCASVMEAYGPYILQMIGQMADSKTLCQEIDLCARTPGHVHLVGGNKCTFGPSYWCKSSTHASACKAEKFCQEKVWKN